MPLRVGFTLLAKSASPQTLQIMGIIGLISSLMFLIVWITGSRKDKGVFGGKVWWNNYRAVHAIVLFIFAINAIQLNPESWKYLAIDTSLGAIFYTLK